VRCTDFDSVCHARPPPSRPLTTFRACRLHRLRKPTPYVAPERRPDAAPSAKPPGSRCLRPCKPVVLSAVSACRRFPDPPTALVRTPSIFQAACRLCQARHNAVSRKPTSEMLPEDRPRCRLCSGPGIRFTGYPAHHRSRHSVERTGTIPASDTPDPRHNPEGGICRRETNVPYETSTVPLPNEEPPQECSRILSISIIPAAAR